MSLPASRLPRRRIIWPPAAATSRPAGRTCDSRNWSWPHPHASARASSLSAPSGRRRFSPLALDADDEIAARTPWARASRWVNLGHDQQILDLVVFLFQPYCLANSRSGAQQ